MFCPRKFTQKISQASGAKHSLVFSNVAGFINPVYYGGQLAKRFFYIGVGTGNLASAIVMVSILKRCHVTVNSDDS
jgi:hypothetical protein